MKKVILLVVILCIKIGLAGEKEALEIALKNIEYKCEVDQKVIEIEGENFIGHYTLDGKPYGEWKFKDDKTRQCFLTEFKSTDIVDYIFLKQTKKYNLMYFYRTKDIYIYIYIYPEKKSYLYELDKNRKYKYIPNTIRTGPTVIPIYRTLKAGTN